MVSSIETVSWAWDGNTNGGNLCRNLGAVCPANTATWDADSQVIAQNVTGFQLQYLKSDGTTATADSDIHAIKIQISIQSAGGTQKITRTMNVTVRPRNLN